MKRILAMLLSAGLLLSCNSGSNKEKETKTEPASEEQKEHTDKEKQFTLNNGAKWKADSITLVNVASLKTIASDAKTGSLEDYLRTASGLESGLNKMIAECKMKGSDHDALHQWLEPVIEKTRDMKKATSMEQAADALGDVRKQLDLFLQYFE